MAETRAVLRHSLRRIVSETTQTRRLDVEDAYLSVVETEIVGTENGGLILAASNFYPAGGGQPGDRGSIELGDGRQIEIVDTLYTADRRSVMLMPAEGSDPVPVGTPVVLHLDWARRYRLMRMHTALHLLTVLCPYPVTGAAVGEEESRLDFDLPGLDADKASLSRDLNALIGQNHPVSTRWITDAELDANPGLVKSANVKPPRGTGRVRLVVIGEEGSIDSQPCGGTHVLETQEIGEVHIAKIEKKGRDNRRFRLRFGPQPV